MTELLMNLKDQAIATTVISLIVIFLVGCLKFIPALKNMKSKDGRKAIYMVINLVLAGGLSVLYQAVILKAPWDMEMLTFAGVVAAEVNVLYPLYENLGIRALLKKIGSLLIPSKSKEVNEVVDKVADAIGAVNEEKQATSAEVAEKQKKSEETGWLE